METSVDFDTKKKLQWKQEASNHIVFVFLNIVTTMWNSARRNEVPICYLLALATNVAEAAGDPIGGSMYYIL